MKILINREAGFIIRTGTPPHVGFTQSQMDYHAIIDQCAGHWLTIDTNFTHEHSYTAVKPDGGFIAIPKEIVTAVTELDLDIPEMTYEQRVSIITVLRTRQRELQARIDKIARKPSTRSVQRRIDRLNTSARLRREIQWIEEVAPRYFGL